MRSLLTVAALLSIACSQSARKRGGTITGSVTDPDGAGVPIAQIEARQVETGATFQAASSVEGKYTLSGLPGGVYQIVVPVIGFTFARFEKKDVVVREAEPLSLHIRLEWGPNQGTPGDDPSISLRAKYASVSGPAPANSRRKAGLLRDLAGS